jgi:hypothetical protein
VGIAGAVVAVVGAGVGVGVGGGGGGGVGVLVTGGVSATELTLIVSDLRAMPDAPLHVIAIIIFPYNGAVERWPAVPTYPVTLPLVAMHFVAEVADHVTMDVPPRRTVSGLAESWMTGAASTRGTIARSVAA